MRCPECGKKQRSKELLKLGHCKKCGRKHKISDFMLKEYYDEIFKPIVEDYPAKIPVPFLRQGYIPGRNLEPVYTYGEL